MIVCLNELIISLQNRFKNVLVLCSSACDIVYALFSS